MPEIFIFLPFNTVYHIAWEHKPFYTRHNDFDFVLDELHMFSFNANWLEIVKLESRLFSATKSSNIVKNLARKQNLCHVLTSHEECFVRLFHSSAEMLCSETEISTLSVKIFSRLRVLNQFSSVS